MRRRLKFIVPLALLIALGGVYKVVLAKPSSAAKPRIAGHVYILPKEFLVNLADGHFAKLNVALVLAPDQALPASEGGTPPPDGFGALPEEAAVRDVITDSLTGGSSGELVARAGRNALKRRILKGIARRTDVHVEQVLLTDIAVQ